MGPQYFLRNPHKKHHHHKLLIFIYFDGGRTRARTWDPLIKSQLLYQLSYAPIKIKPPGPSWSRRMTVL